MHNDFLAPFPLSSSLVDRNVARQTVNIVLDGCNRLLYVIQHVIIVSVMWLPDGKHPGDREQSTSVTWRRRIDDQTELLGCARCGKQVEIRAKKNDCRNSWRAWVSVDFGYN